MATKNAINKRRNVERLKGSSSINPSKVDDALHEMEDVSLSSLLATCADHQANNLEDQLSSRLNAISQNLHVSLRSHSRQAHEDVAVALLENARLSIGYHRHLLRELEALRPDIAKIDTNAPISTVSTTAPLTPSKPQVNIQPPQMAGSRPYQSPPRQQAPIPDASRSMFLPAQSHPTGPNSTGPPPMIRSQSPLVYTQPAQGVAVHQNDQPRVSGQAQTMGRTQGRRLDERQAAKMLAGGF